MVTTVLVTGAGGASGIGAIRSLQETTEYEVVGVDMNPDAAGLFLADEGTVVPRATADDWPSVIQYVVERFDIDVIVPTVDEELTVLDTLQTSVPMLAPRQGVIETTVDKYRSTKILEEAGHVVPETWLGSDAPNDVPFPLVGKPRFGRGSRGVEVLEDAAEVDEYLREAEYASEHVVLQEYVDGREFTTSVVGTDDGDLLAVVPKEALLKRGSTVKGVTRDLPAVSKSCRRTFETLDPHGPLNVQQILDADGRPHTIEINPRFSSTSCLTVAAGVDEFDLLIRAALGEDVEYVPEHEPDVLMLRYDDHIFVDEEEAG